MRIAIDVRPLNQTLTGIGRYTLNILKYLLENEECEWFLYSCRELSIELNLPQKSNIHYRYLTDFAFIPSTACSQLIFPIWARKDNIDVFWAPGQHLPLLTPSKIKLVLTIHDLVCHYYPETMTKRARKLDQWLIPLGLKKAHHILSVSNKTAEELMHVYDIDKNRISITSLAPTALPPGINPKLPALIKGFPYILFVGTLEPRKNLYNLLDAFSQIKKEYKDFKLVICGQLGWLDGSLEQVVMKLQLEDDVLLTGYVSEQELHGLYQHTAVLAMPSLYEGFGLPALEALAYQRPVVVTPNTEVSRLKSTLIYRCQDCSSRSIYQALKSAMNKSHTKERLTKLCNVSWRDIALQISCIFRKEIK